MEEIDDALVTGQSQRAVAASYRVSSDAVQRHARNHLAAGLRVAAQRRDDVRMDDLLVGMVNLAGEANDVLDRAKAKADERLILAALREVRTTYESMRSMVAIPGDAEVTALVVALGKVLPHFPDAASALACELQRAGQSETAQVIALVGRKT